MAPIMVLKKFKKIIALIILILCLLQPLVCFSHPCASGLGCLDTMETSETSENDTHNQNADNCDLTVCCAEYVNSIDSIGAAYDPLVSVFATPERESMLPKIVMPIFIPPQILS